MSAKEILAELEKTRVSINSLDAPSTSGVYAIFLNSGAKFPLASIPSSGLVYIGVSRSLSSRQFDTHFSSGKTGFSTLRRSIGALLKDELRLVAVPRGGGSESNYRCYRFTSDSEERLSTWMRDNLEVGICPCEDYEAMEGQLISALNPVLCLEGWPNPFARPIKDLRKRCIEEARLQKIKGIRS